jgi:fructose-specific phosphotransferase system IIC component
MCYKTRPTECELTVRLTASCGSRHQMIAIKKLRQNILGLHWTRQLNYIMEIIFYPLTEFLLIGIMLSFVFHPTVRVCNLKLLYIVKLIGLDN